MKIPSIFIRYLIHGPAPSLISETYQAWSEI